MLAFIFLDIEVDLSGRGWVCLVCVCCVKEFKVPKLKTKSAAKKRFNLTASGMVTAQSAFKRHGLRKRPQKMKRQARGTMILSESDAKNIMKYLPYK
jgi:large subunit ribosomal protein L35